MRRITKLSPKTILLHTCLVLAALQFSGCSSREQRAENYYQNAKTYIEQKDYAKARVELRNALQLRGDYIDAWRALAEVDEHDRNLQSLIGSLRRVVELDDKDAVARAKLGRLYLAGGALSEAIKVANEAEELQPDNASILALKAATLFRLKDAGGAVRAANKALQLDAGNPDASVVLAAEQFLRGDSDGALKTLAAVKEGNKDDLAVVLLKINILDRKGDNAEVESLLKKLVAAHPSETIFRTQLIRFYLARKRPDDAENELRTAVAKNPDDAGAELQLVEILRTQKGPAAARAELVTRIGAGGKVFPYQIALAQLDYSQGNFDASKKLLEDLISAKLTAEETAAAKVTLAQMYLARQNDTAAETLVREVLTADSRNIEGLRLRAAIRLNRQQFEDAIADLRQALNDQPRSAPLLANLALAYERSGAIDLADKAFLDATRASNFAPMYGLNYVAFLQRRNLPAQAENMLVQLAGRNPNNVDVLTALAKIKLERQDWVGAHQAADAIRSVGDRSGLAEQIHGAAFGGQNKVGDSLATLKDAYDANPNATQPMAALVTGYMRAKQPEKAQAFLEAALKANPQNGEALVLMGGLQLSKNDIAGAEKYFKSAIQAQPDNAVGYAALSELYVHQRKIDDALKVLQTGLEKQPKSFQLRLSQAGLLEIKRDYDGAISVYEVMLKDQPGSMIIANNLASLLADHRTDKESLERAKALALLLKSSEIPQFKDTLGWVSYQQGDYAAAMPLLEDAVAKMPNYALVRYHLGVTYQAVGESEKAADQFKKARELAPNDAELNQKIDAALKSRVDKNNKG
jgi:Tfp pilus assembly protein PilF